MNRRSFIHMSAAATVSAVAKPLVALAQRRGPIGANDRVRMGIIGAGNRGNEVITSFEEGKHAHVFVGACDVFKERLDSTVARLAKSGTKVDAYEDYRRLLDRKDIDALLVATPDHWHSKITIDACAAGKDVYLEKPSCNDATIEEAVKAIQAARKYDCIVQLGTEQRSWPMFAEARELIPQLGGVTHVVIQQPGGGSPTTELVVPVPAGVNWDMFQGPAPRKPYKSGRQRGWRYYLDYGGGLITDWGVHWTDTALWFMNAQLEAPTMASGVGQYVNVDNPDHDRPHNAFTGSWQYSKFVMSFSNLVWSDPEFPTNGVSFYGRRGTLVINRSGYVLRPAAGRGGGGRGAAGAVGPGTAPPGLPPATGTPGTAGGRGSAVAPSRGGGAAASEPSQPPLEGRLVRAASGNQTAMATTLHVDNFLECVKSRQKPNSDVEIGFYATLPCVLALRSMREGRAFTFDSSKMAVRAM
jgi:predicted dehydrogenase